MASSIYKAIPGVGTGRFGLQAAMRSRIYAAPDHLLVVHSTGYTEEYRRVFFRDIRYVNIRPSPRRNWIAVVSAIIIGAIAFLLLIPTPIAVLAFLEAPFVLWFIINLILGPSISCYVTTNVQTLKLPAPRRHGKVVPFVAFVREKAAEAGASVSPAPAPAPVPSA